MTDIMKANKRGFRHVGAFLAALGILISVIAITAVVGDLRKLGELWADLHWYSLTYLAILALLDHLLRYWRWELLLKRVSSKSLNHGMALLTFFAGSLLIFTPGRVGEAAKSIYARDFFAIPLAASLPILVAERISDMVVMAVLAGIGLLLLGEPVSALLSTIILGGVLSVTVLRRPLLKWVSARLMRSESSLGQAFNQASNSQITLVGPGALATNAALGFAAWMTEVFIFFVSLWAVGVPAGMHLFVLSLAVFPLGSLAGSLSFLPGGLGATEGGVIALGVLLGGIEEEAVVLSALLARAAILGTVIVIGLVALAFLHRKLRQRD